MGDNLEKCRCVELDGRRACVSLESDFWECLEQIAHHSSTTLGRLVAYIGGDADNDELSALLRVFVLNYYQEGAAVMRLEAERADLVGSEISDGIFKKRSYH